ncbi:hypothetical protein [Pseudomonas sp. EA_15y_Pfl1_P101]|uniref:hypothetical protein n=1 Tax=Pseudomonas sp. EA_15y_Pfl1_P101 TaxID=3088684 RepID=UPI00403F6FE0
MLIVCKNAVWLKAVLIVCKSAVWLKAVLIVCKNAVWLKAVLIVYKATTLNLPLLAGTPNRPDQPVFFRPLLMQLTVHPQHRLADLNWRKPGA